MNAVIDRRACIGCGLCADVCPEVFRMDPDELAEVWADVTPATLENAQVAAESCPAGAVHLNA